MGLDADGGSQGLLIKLQSPAHEGGLEGLGKGVVHQGLVFGEQGAVEGCQPVCQLLDRRPGLDHVLQSAGTQPRFSGRDPEGFGPQQRIVEVQGTGLGHLLLEDLGAEGVEGSLGSGNVLLGRTPRSPAGLRSRAVSRSGAVFKGRAAFSGLPDPLTATGGEKQGQGQEPP